MAIFKEFRERLKSFSPKERRAIFFYICGIMLYKFGLEAFNGSITALATNRYDYESDTNGTPSRTFERLGLLQGLNQATQCVGSILIAPLIKHYPTKNVLSSAILLFGLMTAILLILDAATGGTFVPAAYRKKHPKDEWSYYGDYNNDAIIPIYTVTGVAYGMVELIRRVIPRDIVGGNVQKLRQMDSLRNALARAEARRSNYFIAIGKGFLLFFESIWVGAKILFTSTRFVWLVPAYGVALYGHRYLENGIAPQVARRYLGNSAWSQIMVGGSNFGELLGALFVFLFTNVIKTPIPWLRLDALMLLIVWYIPYWYPPSGQVGQAWIVAATFLPVSFGWAAGDVSLAAFIQASLARLESKEHRVSPLGAVMAFLYSFYIVTYAIAGTFLGRYLDGVYNRTGSVREALVNTAGVHFTIIMAVVFASTFIPKGSRAFNPEMLDDTKLDEDIEEMLPSSSEKDMVDDPKLNEKTPAIII
ncbi:major facilitator superfamily domain general substrate transporter protein [Colletotrichum incanum]|uniref:Major facilitator superfamily domain general substrate transporter protein n=1 Tax=Colletotrichum incanum TaxID=1573173 RepID=A0A161Y7B4_COLIC|nr:major facilitator superfamily domain general substrate transporter protein [Colletotrichum incanum]